MMNIVDGALVVDYGDVRDVKQMLQGGTDLNGCIESLFIVSGQEPTWVQNVKLSSEPNENQREFAEMVLQAIKEFIQLKKSE